MYHSWSIMLLAFLLILHFTIERKLCEYRDLTYTVTPVSPTPRTYPGLEKALKFSKCIKSISKVFYKYFT